MPLVGVPEVLPTCLVTFVNGGHQALINVKDFDPSLHVKMTQPTVRTIPMPPMVIVTPGAAVDQRDATIAALQAQLAALSGGTASPVRKRGYRVKSAMLKLTAAEKRAARIAKKLEKATRATSAVVVPGVVVTEEPG